MQHFLIRNVLARTSEVEKLLNNLVPRLDHLALRLNLLVLQYLGFVLSFAKLALIGSIG